mgnify:CR=1 FL=1
MEQQHEQLFTESAVPAPDEENSVSLAHVFGEVLLEVRKLAIPVVKRLVLVEGLVPELLFVVILDVVRTQILLHIPIGLKLGG